MAAKVWGSVPNIVQQPVSFRDLMSEELAHKIEKDDEPTIVENIVDDDDMDDDLRMALELSKMAMESPQNNNNSETTPQENDDDYVLALKLQEEEQKLQQPKRNHVSNAKVSIMYDDEESAYDDAEEEEEEEYSDDEEDLEDDDKFAQLLNTLGEGIVTKHDAVISGMRNAESIEESINSGSIDMPISNPVSNSLRHHTKRQENSQNKVRGNRLDKSTNEQVLDQRTREKILKFLNSGVLSEINGVVNTGKEANVYHAIAGPKIAELEGQEIAVKIYKTSMNEFKKRTEYIANPVTNPRKLIKMWAEKEIQNLRRLNNNGILVPTPVLQHENLLLMTFVGKSGVPAPLLKDVELSEKKLASVYMQVVNIMRTLYQTCKLVHADLSEYNMLYQKGKVIVIDVSQSVDTNHGRAMEFLRRDASAVSNFFAKRGLSPVLSASELFKFITDATVTDQRLTPFLKEAETTTEEDAE